VRTIDRDSVVYGARLKVRDGQHVEKARSASRTSSTR